MRKLSFVFTCLFTVLLMSGCNKLVQQAVQTLQSGANSASTTDADDWEASAVKTEADLTYQNSFLGFSYTIPKDWWLYRLNGYNFDPDPSVTENPEILDISYGVDEGYDYSYIDLVDFANLKDSRMDNHIGIDISAETLEGINSLNDYMKYFESYMLRPDENTYKLLDSSSAVINGQRYETRNFEVVRDIGNFIYITYTRPVRDNYYLTIKASYWPDNRNALTFITNSLTKAMP